MKETSYTLFFFIELFRIWKSSSTTVVFQLGQTSESSVDACARIGMIPVSSQTAISWAPPMLASAVKNLQRSTMNGTTGLFGCCVPGLWCNGSVCFTQSLSGYFSNYGAIAESKYEEYLPVYACYDSGAWYGDVPVLAASVDEDDILTITTSTLSLGVDAAAISVEIDGQRCHQLEICSQSCRPCSGSYDCQSNAVCVGDGTISLCFIHCGGPNDMSCPCGQGCQPLVLSVGQGLFFELNVCAPRPFVFSKAEAHPLVNGVCQDYDVFADRLHCRAPRRSAEKSSYSVTVSQVSVSSTLSYGAVDAVLVPGECTDDSQCVDGSVCTRDECVEGRCAYSLIDPGCITTPHAITDSTSPISYWIVRQTNMQESQQKLATLIRTQGVVSSATTTQLQLIQLQFSFEFFGNLIRTLAINPSGVLLFPPFLPCKGPIGSLLCIAYSSYTNVLSLWTSRWITNPKKSLASQAFKTGFILMTGYKQRSAGPVIMHMHQSPRMRTRAADNMTTFAFHTMYSQMSKAPGATTPGPSSFSSSIYSDGSIRLRYHVVGSSFDFQDTIGLWGATASQRPGASSVNFNKNISVDAIQSGTDLSFCPYSAVVSPVSACVSPTAPLVLQWAGINCTALRDTIVFYCVWSDGFHVTNGTYDAGAPPGTLTCPVPLMPTIKDGSLLSVSIIMSTSNGDVLGDGPNNSEPFLYAMSHTNGELSRHAIMVRYSSSGDGGCGCSALKGFEMLQIDRCGVCGGYNVTVDCNGDCFGSAYLDTTNKCSRGLTNVIPSGSVSPLTVSSNYLADFSSRLLTLLGMLALVLVSSFCMACICSIIRVAVLSSVIRAGGRDEPVALGVPAPVRAAAAPPRSNALPSQLLESIGSFTYQQNPSQEGINAVECSICLCALEHGEACRQLPSPCEHTFHMNCIDTWFLHSRFCPVCRRSIEDIVASEGGDGRASSVVNPLYGWLTALRENRPYTLLRDESRV